MSDTERSRGARERILQAAVRRIASEGIDGVRIARLAMDARVSSALVHYHFETRDQLLAEALEYSYKHAGEIRVPDEPPGGASHAERLAAMIDSCLPGSDVQRDDWALWLELWLRAARESGLRPFAEDLYGRLHDWFAREIEAGVADGEFARCDPDEVADHALALIDGFGVRALIGDPAVTLERARRSIAAVLAAELGLGEQLARPAAGGPTSPPDELERSGS
jgi:AcrR family transcriptional regulator